MSAEPLLLSKCTEDPLEEHSSKSSQKKELSRVEKEILAHDVYTSKGVTGKLVLPTEHRDKRKGSKSTKRSPLGIKTIGSPLFTSVDESKIGPNTKKGFTGPKPSQGFVFRTTPSNTVLRQSEKKRSLDDFSEDEWTDRGNFHNESSVLQCEILFQSPTKEETTTDNYGRVVPQDTIPGVLTITTYQLFFECNKSEALDGHVCVPVSQISKISTKKTNVGRSMEAMQLEISTRDFRCYKFIFTIDKQHSRKTNITPDRVVEMLYKMCFPKTNFLFAFDYGRNRKSPLTHVKYDAMKDFKRMGIETEGVSYRFSTINKKYKFSESYPKLLVFPGLINDQDVAACGEFRRRARVPVLTWKRRGNLSAIFRSSQPRVGIMSNSCAADGSLLRAIHSTNKGSPVLYILDCRPWKNAIANMVGGAGFESTEAYKDFSKMEFLDIENIHVMIRSRARLGAAIHQNRKGNSVENLDLQWLQNLAASGWMSHVRLVIKGAVSVIEKIHEEGCSVLLHCSDGWDRTAQVSALAQLCLDSHYRTVDGFITLIQKDWLSFGHNFHTRGGFGQPDEQNGKRSPVFEQFIDALFQVLIQYPTAFEFTTDFLRVILQQFYSCRFGTFIYNSQKERDENHVATKTACLWTYLKEFHIHRHKFYNHFYLRTDEVLKPKYSLKILRFWAEYYLEHAPENYCSGARKPILEVNAQESMEKVLKQVKLELQEAQERLRDMAKNNGDESKLPSVNPSAELPVEIKEEVEEEDRLPNDEGALGQSPVRDVSFLLNLTPNNELNNLAAQEPSDLDLS